MRSKRMSRVVMHCIVILSLFGNVPLRTFTHAGLVALAMLATLKASWFSD